MFEDFRTRYRAVFRDVSDDEYGGFARFGEPHKARRAFLYLPDAACGRIHLFQVNSLYGVDYQKVVTVGAVQYIVKRRLVYDHQFRKIAFKPFATHPYLCAALFRRGVQYFIFFGKGTRDLRHKRRLAYARVSAEKYQRRRNDASAEYGVEFVYARFYSYRLFDCHVAEFHGAFVISRR